MSEFGAHAHVMGEIIDRVGAILHQRGAGLVEGGTVDAMFVRNVEEILTETLQALDSTSEDLPAVSVEYAPGTELAATAMHTVERGIHPAEALMAAEVLFGAALPLLSEHYVRKDGSRPSDIRIAQVLHHCIWRRFPHGAIAYVELILDQLSTANIETRKKLSRELHDRVSHRLLAAAQRLELIALRTMSRSNRREIDDTAAVVREAIRDVQDIAVSLRAMVGDRALVEAVAEHVADRARSGSAVIVDELGTPVNVSSAVAEEVFTITAEAIDNSLRHASSATRRTVTLDWTRGNLVVRIADDGPGFDPKHVRADSIGLASMRERAAVIQGQLDIDASRRGTIVTLSVPTRPAAV